MSPSAAAPGTPAAPRLPRRGSSLALGLLAALLLAALGAAAHAAWATDAARARLRQAQALVRTLDLTDMAWFPEARYTRHPSQADLHSAFQDAPGSFEHFPAGSILAPARPAPVPHSPPAGFATAPPQRE